MEPLTVISDDSILVDWGPMTLTVSAWAKGQPKLDAALPAAREALKSLTILADFKNYLKLSQSRLTENRPLPEVVHRAVTAVGAVGSSLTPMAAVAGAVADQVGQRAYLQGADRVIVNNGGDLSVKPSSKQPIVVGLKPPGAETLIARLEVQDGDNIGGIATSGWSGRSLSTGIADMVTAWSSTGALADAAATYIAGSCACDHPAVTRSPARRFDPDTDLRNTSVTAWVGSLDRAESLAAIASGSRVALKLIEDGRIYGFFIKVQDEIASFDPAGRLFLSDLPVPAMNQNTRKLKYLER